MNGLRFISLVISALSAFTIYLIVISSDPNTIGLNIKLLFYISTSACITATILFIRINLHGYMRKNALEPVPVFQALRYGFISSLVIVSFLLLLSLKSLSGLDAVLIIAAALLFELFFRVRVPLKHEKQP